MTEGFQFDLTPDPKVLIALTHTPLAPLDALSELIDNSIDSFSHAAMLGAPVEFPLIVVDLPGPAEVSRGEGRVVVRDNGPGLTAEHSEQALRAGYSSNNPHDRLGLFGMGFNIATGKLGRRTTFLTARAADAEALEVVIDLPAMQEMKTYHVPVRRVPKPHGFTHGSIVEVTGWWPEGNANAGFIRKLASYGKATVLRELGRRYATLLRPEMGIRLLVKNDRCIPFEHCHWSRDRFVERREHGRIPAVLDVDKVLHTQTRCTACDALITAGAAACGGCGSSSFRSYEERVRGWVGIQRFDDPTEFGIDLIRNGRAIKINEKAAFFTFIDEFKREIKDYPIDSPYGRIIGEVHLDHVPVDFLKQDFQRSSEEWQRAVTFLRGASSLQPTQVNAPENSSPVFRLYQGYRRVRTPGHTDLYMGSWDSDAGKPRRISREIEKAYYDRFLERLPGYFDDAEWWKLVEQADQKPLEELPECPACGVENLKTQEVCINCQHVLIGQVCIGEGCGATLPKSAVLCPACGTSQIVHVEMPWSCAVCGYPNGGEHETCSRCSSPRGAADPGSLEALVTQSSKLDELSLNGLTIKLADGTFSAPLTVAVAKTSGAIVPRWEGPSVPLLSFRGDTYSIFIDTAHPVFRGLKIRPEVLVAADVAQFIYDQNRSLLTAPNRGLHTIAQLVWEILDGRWADDLEDSPDKIRQEIQDLFAGIREKLPVLAAPIARDLYAELSEDEQRILVSNIMSAGEDISQLGHWRDTGEYLAWVGPATVIHIFQSRPDLFFDGGVWTQMWTGLEALAEPVLRSVQEEIRSKYLNCLEDCVSFLRYSSPEPIVIMRARGSLDFLSMKLL